MEIKYAFKKKVGPGANVKSKIVAKAIQFWTSSEYFHVEIIIKDKWISSSPENGGVKIRELRPLQDSWDYVTLEVDGRRLQCVYKWLESLQGAKYDWKGIFLSQVIELGVQDDSKWFCSELGMELLKRFNYKKVKNINNSYISPGELYSLLTEKEKNEI